MQKLIDFITLMLYIDLAVTLFVLTIAMIIAAVWGSIWLYEIFRDAWKAPPALKASGQPDAPDLHACPIHPLGAWQHGLGRDEHQPHGPLRKKD